MFSIIGDVMLRVDISWIIQDKTVDLKYVNIESSKRR